MSTRAIPRFLRAASEHIIALVVVVVLVAGPIMLKDAVGATKPAQTFDVVDAFSGIIF